MERRKSFLDILLSNLKKETNNKGIDRDYQKAVFLYCVKNKPLKEKDDYPRYTKYELDINNPKAYHEKMIKEGYLIKDTNSDKYILSNKGNDYLKEFDYCVLLHQHKNLEISLDEYLSKKKTLAPYLKFNDIVWDILNERINDYYINGKWYKYRNTLLNMSNLLYEEKKYKDCLRFTLWALYVDLNAIDDDITFAPFIIEKTKKLKEYYTDEILDKIYRIKFPMQRCDRKMFKEIVNDMMNDNVFDEEKWISQLEKKKGSTS